MLVVLSPAKKLSLEGEKPAEYTMPQFSHKAEELIKVLEKYSPENISDLMHISPALAALNVQRYSEWSAAHKINDCKQVAVAFTGEVYNGLNAASFSKKDVGFSQNHLRVLSGLYGVLKPFDLIHAYRLEMGSQLKVEQHKNLYEFWKPIIAKEINKVLQEQGDNIIVNLASNEYFKAIDKKQLNAEIITPVFKDFKNGDYKTIMVYTKRARGMMASFIMKNQLTNTKDLVAFDTDGYCFNEAASNTKELVFYRG